MAGFAEAGVFTYARIIFVFISLYSSTIIQVLVVVFFLGGGWRSWGTDFLNIIYYIYSVDNGHFAAAFVIAMPSSALTKVYTVPAHTVCTQAISCLPGISKAGTVRIAEIQK